MRILRRRLGLSQRELALLLGYGSDSHISRMEDGSRLPNIFEGLMLELVFEMDCGLIFDGLREKARNELVQRIRNLKAEAAGSPYSRRRMSYKTAQLDRLLVLLRAKAGSI